MINNLGGRHPALDRITRITPTMRGLARDEGLRWSADMGVSVALGLV